MKSVGTNYNAKKGTQYEYYPYLIRKKSGLALHDLGYVHVNRGAAVKSEEKNEENWNTARPMRWGLLENPHTRERSFLGAVHTSPGASPDEQIKQHYKSAKVISEKMHLPFVMMGDFYGKDDLGIPPEHIIRTKKSTNFAWNQTKERTAADYFISNSTSRHLRPKVHASAKELFKLGISDHAPSTLKTQFSQNQPALNSKRMIDLSKSAVADVNRMRRQGGAGSRAELGLSERYSRRIHDKLIQDSAGHQKKKLLKPTKQLAPKNRKKKSAELKRWLEKYHRKNKRDRKWKALNQELDQGGQQSLQESISFNPYNKSTVTVDPNQPQGGGRGSNDFDFLNDDNFGQVEPNLRPTAMRAQQTQQQLSAFRENLANLKEIVMKNASPNSDSQQRSNNTNSSNVMDIDGPDDETIPVPD